MDKKEIVDIIHRFRDLTVEAQSIAEQCEMTIKEADKAFGDIRHYCEFNKSIDARTKTKICRLMREYSEKRREAKDTLEIISALNEYISQNREFVSNIGYIWNTTNKKWKFVNSERVYVPRVLEELFERKGE